MMTKEGCCCCKHHNLSSVTSCCSIILILLHCAITFVRLDSAHVVRRVHVVFVCLGQNLSTILSAGANSIMEDDSRSELTLAAMQGQVDVVQELLTNGARVGPYALSRAADGGHITVVRLLLDAGADANGVCCHDCNETALHSAAACRSAEVLRMLLAAGADVSAVTCNEQTPLHIAAFYGCPENISVLLSARANVNARDSGQRTPLHQAAHALHVENVSVSVLLSAGADVNAVDSNGNTPLHNAAFHGYIGAAKTLIANGAVAWRTNGRGETPADVFGRRPWTEADAATFNSLASQVKYQYHSRHHCLFTMFLLCLFLLCQICQRTFVGFIFGYRYLPLNCNTNTEQR